MTYNDMKFAEQKRTRKGEFIESDILPGNLFRGGCQNNTIGNNILLLCPNCHSAEHYKHKDGKYRPGKGRPYES